MHRAAAHPAAILRHAVGVRVADRLWVACAEEGGVVDEARLATGETEAQDAQHQQEGTQGHGDRASCPCAKRGGMLRPPLLTESVQRFMLPRNSALSAVGRMCLSTNSIASMGVKGCSTCRRAVMRTRSCSGSSSSSFRVPDLLMSSVGKIRFSISLRSSTTSELPV